MGYRATLVSALVMVAAADLTGSAYAQAPAGNPPTNVPRPAPATSTFPVAINSVPPGANIYVDDKARGLQGQTGPNSVIRLPRGSRQILLELDGYQPLAVTLDLWQAQHLNFILKPAPATVEVRALLSSPALMGAEVYVDGKLVGTIPYVATIAAGKHMLEVKREGAAPYAEPFEIHSGETRALYVPATPDKSVAPAPPSAPLLAVVVAPPPVADFVRDPLSPAPTPPGETVLAAIVPRSMKYNYQVTLGSGQSCQTPCNLQVRPGATSILVAGPGQRQFQRTIVIPPQPVEIRVQDYSLARIILGSFFASWSLPLLGAGGAVLSDRGGELTGSIILTHGLIFLGLGAGLLGTIHTNRATVTPINMPRRKLEVVGSSLTPTADRTGVVGSVKVLF